MNARKRGDLDGARKIIYKLVHVAQVIRHHLKEPKYVPENSKDDLHKTLIQFETRTDEINMACANRSWRKIAISLIGGSLTSFGGEDSLTLPF